MPKENRYVLELGPERRTRDQFESRIRRIAGLLRDAGLVTGDRIAVLSANRPEFLEITSGALRAGIVPVPVSPLLTNPEVEHLLEDSGADWLFSDRDGPSPGGLKQTSFGPEFESQLGKTAPAEITDVALTRPMHYTSGTTGRPKGVWVAPAPATVAQRASERFRRTWGLRPHDIHLVCSPLTHSAPHRFAIRTIEAGGCVVLMDRFDAAAVLELVKRHRVTTTFMVPTHLERIFALPRSLLDEADVSSLRLVAHAGAPIRESTKRRALEFFPQDSVWEFYGSTEGGFTRIGPSEWLAKPGSVGRPDAGAEIIVTDRDGERELAPNRPGRIWVRDPAAERFEYWGDEAKTKEAWRDGAFSVGDIGLVDDDGFLFLVGRAHDVIISGGVNVYPQEVEATLAEHPDVHEALVYGAPDDEWGQEVRALVVPAPGRVPGPDSVLEWAGTRLAGYKRPRAIRVVEALPRTSTGKLIRRNPDDRQAEGRV